MGWALIFRPPPAASWPNACAPFAPAGKRMLWRAGRGFVVRDRRSGVSAEHRHLKKPDKFAAVCRRAATKQENRSPSP